MTLPDSAIVLQRGEGDSVAIGTGTRCTFKVRGKDTEGHFGLFEYTMEPGTEGPRRHIHRQMAEIFYVVEGAIELLVGDEKMTAQAGTTALVPKEAIHAFSNPGTQRSVLLVIFCPADSREKYFEGLAELTKDGKPPDQNALLELMRKYDTEPVAEPLYGEAEPR